MYTVLVEKGSNRDEFVEALNERGIGASVHFDPPVHQQPQYEGGNYRKMDLSATEHLASKIVTLPMYPGLKREDLDRVVEAVEESLSEV
jgi:dTDP-4-amino-4,6-dideoxygalactose transaminase